MKIYIHANYKITIIEEKQTLVSMEIDEFAGNEEILQEIRKHVNKLKLKTVADMGEMHTTSVNVLDPKLIAYYYSNADGTLDPDNCVVIEDDTI